MGYECGPPPRLDRNRKCKYFAHKMDVVAPWWYWAISWPFWAWASIGIAGVCILFVVFGWPIMMIESMLEKAKQSHYRKKGIRLKYQEVEGGPWKVKYIDYPWNGLKEEDYEEIDRDVLRSRTECGKRNTNIQGQ